MTNQLNDDVNHTHSQSVAVVGRQDINVSPRLQSRKENIEHLVIIFKMSMRRFGLGHTCSPCSKFDVFGRLLQDSMRHQVQERMCD